MHQDVGVALWRGSVGILVIPFDVGNEARRIWYGWTPVMLLVTCLVWENICPSNDYKSVEFSLQGNVKIVKGGQNHMNIEACEYTKCFTEKRTNEDGKH